MVPKGIDVNLSLTTIILYIFRSDKVAPWRLGLLLAHSRSCCFHLGSRKVQILPSSDLHLQNQEKDKDFLLLSLFTSPTILESSLSFPLGSWWDGYRQLQKQVRRSTQLKYMPPYQKMVAMLELWVNLRNLGKGGGWFPTHGKVKNQKYS